MSPADWPAIERLFGANGACGGCWCMLWRVPSTGRYWEEVKGEPNRKAFRRLIESGRAQGCLAFLGDDPVGWCSVGAATEFDYLRRARRLHALDEPGAHVVTCFFIRKDQRGCGVAGRLLDAAIGLATDAGAPALYGYPSVPKSADRAIPSAFAHTGVPALFESFGFDPVADAGARRIYRLGLNPR